MTVNGEALPPAAPPAEALAGYTSALYRCEEDAETMGRSSGGTVPVVANHVQNRAGEKGLNDGVLSADAVKGGLRAHCSDRAGVNWL